MSGIAAGSEKSSAGVGGPVKIPLDCTVSPIAGFVWFLAIAVLKLCNEFSGIFKPPKQKGILPNDHTPEMQYSSQNKYYQGQISGKC